jgi:hypothetical protein
MQNARIKKSVLEESAVWEKSDILYTCYGKLARSSPLGRLGSVPVRLLTDATK